MALGFTRHADDVSLSIRFSLASNYMVEFSHHAQSQVARQQNCDLPATQSAPITKTQLLGAHGILGVLGVMVDRGKRAIDRKSVNNSFVPSQQLVPVWSNNN